MKIKIAHITQSLGGVKTYLEHIFNYSDKIAFEYIIIAPEHAEFQELCKKNGVKYYPVKIKRSINPIKDAAAFFSILSILKNEKPDIVHTHSAKGGFIGRFAASFTKAKIIYSPHAFSYLSFKGLKRVIFYSLEFMAKRWTDILLSVSFSEASRAIYELDYRNDQVKTILNAIAVDDNLQFRNYKNCTHIGMIGRLTYQKNPLLFLQIAASQIKQNPFLHFSILGAGLTDHLTCEIQQFLRANQLQHKIDILKWGDNETSKNFLKSIDVFVMTSVFEGLPFSLIEAMSLGIPCVVSKVDGNTDVIHNNENGYSCLSLAEFEDKISTLIAHEDLRRKFGQAGYRYVKVTHEIHKNITQLEKLYQSLFYNEEVVDINKSRLGFDVRLKVSPGI